MLSGLTKPVREWVESLDGTRDLECVLHEAALAGLDEIRARSMLNQLAAQGALHDAGTDPGLLRDLPLAERDRLKPDLDALDLASTAPDGVIARFERRRMTRVRVYGAGRVGAQVVALLAASGVGTVRVIDPGTARPSDITPGGLTWAEVGMPREAGAVAVARRLTSGGADPMETDEFGNPHEPTDAAQPDATLKGAPRTPRLGPRTARSSRTSRASESTQAEASRRAAQPTATTRAVQSVQAARTGAATSPKAPPRPSPAAPPKAPFAGPAPTTPPKTPSAGPATATPTKKPFAGSAADAPPRGPSTNPAPTTAPRAPSAGAPLASGSRGTIPAPTDADEVDEEERCAEVIRPTVNALAGGPYLGDKSDRPDLVILTPVTPLDGILVNELNSLEIPHLLASAFEGHGTVGPLVLPGDTACLHCLDLTRRDRDPAWPIVTARLGGYPPGEIACDATLATVVAAEAVGHALAFLDGRESVVTNGTMDVTPDWRWKRRSWKLHPHCRCSRNNPYSLRMVMAPDRD
ncbi:ThiF family protein [Nonomuraea solani]|uniref:ThiF family protein n=1 Tax=Nonomuraea solani TaxID=1144553 RepID=A0A1H6F2G2_9ACTN|nr:ThiF family adenylyltransferase [Nonomuraea solani]SEH03571.1 ThiF family protein [Nonomuraea solani]